MVRPIARPVNRNLMSDGGPLRTAAVFQYAPDGYDGHFVAASNPTAIADWTAFIRSYVFTGTPSVP